MSLEALVCFVALVPVCGAFWISAYVARAGQKGMAEKCQRLEQMLRDVEKGRDHYRRACRKLEQKLKALTWGGHNRVSHLGDIWN